MSSPAKEMKVGPWDSAEKCLKTPGNIAYEKGLGKHETL